MIEASKQERKKIVTDETGRDEKAIYGRIEVKQKRKRMYEEGGKRIHEKAKIEEQKKIKQMKNADMINRATPWS